MRAANWVGYGRARRALERLDELIEQPVGAARRGSTITLGDITLVGDSFVTVFRDLITYCVESWDTRDYRRVCLIERQVARLGGYMTRVFSRERKHRAQRLARDEHQELQVIACPAPPTRLNAMRLGRSPQVDFLGPWEHEGLAWLASRAQDWPADYYAHCWQPFLAAQCH